MPAIRAAAPRLWLFDIDGTLVPQSADRHDVTGAHSNGAVAIAVCTGTTPGERLATAGPNLLVGDLPELLSRLRRTEVPWLLSAHPA